MRKLLYSLTLIIGTVMFSWAQTGQVNTFAVYTNNNGSSAISFEIETTIPIEITGIANTYNTGAITAEVWIKPGGITTTAPPLSVTTANGWILHQTIPITGLGGATTTPLTGLNPIDVDPGTPMGIVITGSMGYHGTNAAPPNPTTFVDGPVTLRTGGTKGYGGAVPSLFNNPRAFIGIVDYAARISVPNNMGVVSLDTPGNSCPGVQNVVATVANFGTNVVTSFDVDWSVDGVQQTGVSSTVTLDTVGSGANSTQIVLGTFNFNQGQPYNIDIWTSNPNGNVDTVTANDTLSETFTLNIPVPANLISTSAGPSNIVVNWVAGAGGQSELSYGLQGVPAGSGTSIFTNGNNQNVTNLSSNTSYDFYVRSICGPGDTSAWVGPLTERTTCTVYNNPFFEDFDGANWPFGTGFTAATSIDPCWSRNPTSGYAWGGLGGPTGSTATGPTGDVSGTGGFVYPEASSGAQNAVSVLTTPPIDCSNLTSPTLEFYYHRFGNGMGDFHVIASSTNQLDTVLTLIGVDPNYNANADPWTFVSIPMPQFGGDTVTIDFVASIGTTGSSFNADMSLDEIKVFQPIPEDFSVIALNSPISGCGLSTTETLDISLVSLGSATFNSGFSFPISAELNGTVTTETVTLAATLNPGDTLDYTFTNTFDLSVAGNYDFKVWATVPGDSANTNDTLYQTVVSIPVIGGYPYLENFEASQGGWISGGANSSWAWGTPAGTNINSASSGVNAWITNLTGFYNSNEASFVEGPCFSFDTLIQPEVSVDVWWDSEFSWDGMQLQYSIDGGTSWNQVSFLGDPNSTNWYTDGTVNGLQSGFNVGDGWTGTGTNSSGTWVTATADLSALAGNTNGVLMRMVFGSDGSVQNGDGVAFDNFSIVETALPFNIENLAILSPNSGCGLGNSDTVRIRYANVGLNPITSGSTINFQYVLNGTAVNESLVLASTLNPNDTAIYEFATTVDLSVPNTYALEVIINYGPDQNAIDDTVSTSILSIPVIDAFPYFQNFESGNGGWASNGTNNSWALGTPAASTINSASSGTNAWTTNLTGDYNSSENSFVTGPCFSFDTLILPELEVDVWWDTEFSWDGMQVQYSNDAGITWQTLSFFGDPNNTNWYNDGTVNGLVGFNTGNDDGWSGNGGNGSGSWLTATADLSSLAGQTSVLMRMAFGSDPSVIAGNGVAFDDFTIIETALPFNVENLEILGLNSDCGLGIDTVTARYANIGLNAIPVGTTMNFEYIVNNGTPTAETLVLTDSIVPGDTLIYEFTTTINLSTPGTYDIDVVVSFAGDQNGLDDTVSTVIDNIPVISTFPYFEDFESGSGGWTAGGNNSTWALGTPAQTNITGAASGTNAWMTGLASNYNNQEASFVLGPCFDFTNLVLPIIKMDVNWNSEPNWDGAQLQASTDAGVTWSQIGNFGDPFNWYNEDNTNGLNTAFGVTESWAGRATSGNGSGGWVNARNNLNTFAGNNAVLMRVVFGSDFSVQDEGFAFDNFHILESPNNDMAVDSLIGLQSGCGYSDSTIITMRITNLGILPQSNVPVFYEVNGVASPTETITNTLNPGQTFVYQFQNAADLSVPQTYTIKGYTALATDEDTTNDDSQAKIFNALFTPQVLTVTDGETCESGPVTLSMTSDGDVDQWFATPGDPTPLATGSTFTIPNVTKDTTFWVQTIMNGTGCNSASAQGRIAVRAFHSVEPVINFSSTVQSSLTIDFTSTLSANVDSVLWLFGDGNTSTQLNPRHTYASSQSYVVELIAFAGSCDDTVSKAVFVPVSGLNKGQYSNLSVFPNPSNGIFNVQADNISGEVEISVISMTGNVRHQEFVTIGGEGLDHNMKIGDLPSGTYILRIQNNDIQINGRIVIE